MMTILSKVKSIISEQTGIPKREIKIDSNLIDDLNINSLTLIEIICDIEDTFIISIPDEDALKCKTVRDIVDYIKAIWGGRDKL